MITTVLVCCCLCCDKTLTKEQVVAEKSQFDLHIGFTVHHWEKWGQEPTPEQRQELKKKAAYWVCSPCLARLPFLFNLGPPTQPGSTAHGGLGPSVSIMSQEYVQRLSYQQVPSTSPGSLLPVVSSLCPIDKKAANIANGSQTGFVSYFPVCIGFSLWGDR